MEQLGLLIEKLDSKSLDMRKQQAILNILKAEIYPDPYSHITTRILEYPQPPTIYDKENEDSSNSIKTTENDENSNSKQQRSRKIRSRKSLRYMTQPVTLLEIRETDEDTAAVATTTTTANNTLANENIDHTAETENNNVLCSTSKNNLNDINRRNIRKQAIRAKELAKEKEKQLTTPLI